jgi:hypothetical protein
MEIKTKYKEGDIVHFMNNNKPQSGAVAGIKISIGKFSYTNPTKDGGQAHGTTTYTNPGIQYSIESPPSVFEKAIPNYIGLFEESKCFDSKEELIQSL